MLVLLPPPLPLNSFCTYRTFLALHPSSLSWWPQCRCPPDCHCPSCWDQIGCLHCPLAISHQRCFFHLHTSPSAQFRLLPRLAAAKQDSLKCGQLLAHTCCFFSDQISPGSAVAKDSADMSWTQWPSISHRCENRMLVLVQGLLYSSSASAAGASLDTDTGHSSLRCCGVTAYGGLGLRQWLWSHLVSWGPPCCPSRLAPRCVCAQEGQWEPRP